MSELKERIEKIKGTHAVKNIGGYDWKIPNLETEEIVKILKIEQEQDPERVMESGKELLKDLFKLNYPDDSEEDIDAAVKTTPFRFLAELIRAIVDYNDSGR